MRKNHFVLLCLRLLGIYFTVLGLSSLPNVIAMFVESSNDMPSYFFISPIVLLLCGVCLYIYAPRIGLYIVEFSEAAEEEGFQINASEKTTRIAFLILGIFIFAEALPQLIQICFNVFLYYKNLDEIPQNFREVQNKWTYVIAPFLKLVIGSVLIIGPDKVVEILGKYDDQFKKLKSSSNGD